MEQINQSRGVPSEISTHDEPVIYDGRTAPPPVTFTEAERRNAYTLLTELHDHALTLDADGRRPDDPRHHLAELALSAAVVAWWSRWQPISMHRAFLAGATLAEIAAATGTTESEAYERWEQWAERQSKLLIGSKPGVEPDEVATIRSRIARSRR